MKSLLRTSAFALALLATCSVSSMADSGLASDPSNNTLTFPALAIEGGTGSQLRCPVTLTTTLHASVAKTTGALAGFTNVTIGTGRCTNGNMGLLLGRNRVVGPQGPYHITYVSFDGNLPSINDITLRINDLHFWFEIVAVLTCLSSGPVDINTTTTGGDPADGMTVSNSGIPLTGGLLCPSVSGRITGDGSFASPMTIELL